METAPAPTASASARASPGSAGCRLVGEVEFGTHLRDRTRRITVAVEEAFNSTAHARPNGYREHHDYKRTGECTERRPDSEFRDKEDREEYDQARAGDPGNDERPPKHQIHLDRPVPKHGDGRCDSEHRNRRGQRRRIHRAAGVEHEREHEVERE